MTPEERADPIAEQMCVELVDAVDAQHLPSWNGYRAAVHAEFKDGKDPLEYLREAREGGMYGET